MRHEDTVGIDTEKCLGIRGRNGTKRCELDSTGSKSLMMGFCEYGSDLLCFIEDRECLGNKGVCQLVERTRLYKVC